MAALVTMLLMLLDSECFVAMETKKHTQCMTGADTYLGGYVKMHNS